MVTTTLLMRTEEWEKVGARGADDLASRRRYRIGTLEMRRWLRWLTMATAMAYMVTL